MASTLPVKVRKTRDRGRGVFACKPFRRNQMLGEMRGRVTDMDHCDPSYCVDLGDAGVLDPFAPFRCLNHSCDPNCELVEYEPEKAGKHPQIFVHARRAIRDGEELTIDYSWAADAAVPCLCGSPKCRGYVVDKKQLKLVKKSIRRSA